MTERTPRFPKPKRGKPWPPEVKALVIVTAEEAATWEQFLEILGSRARWPNGTPPDRTLRSWLAGAGLSLARGNAADSARGAHSAEARAARFARLEHHRMELSELLGARIMPSAARLIIDRLEEAQEVEERVKGARRRLDEALVMQSAAAEMGEESRRSARREVVLARLLLQVEQADRIELRDLLRLVDRGVVRHLELEGLAEPEDDETNPIIVELHIPRPDPNIVEAQVIPQHALPEHTAERTD